jgi:GTP cyclohydrolase III
LYAGKPAKGLTSLAIQSALAYYAFISITSGYYLIGAASITGIGGMFYIGGANYAAYLAKDKNQSRINQYNNKIQNMLLTIEEIKINN